MLKLSSIIFKICLVFKKANVKVLFACYGDPDKLRTFGKQGAKSLKNI